MPGRDQDVEVASDELIDTIRDHRLADLPDSEREHRTRMLDEVIDDHDLDTDGPKN